MALFPCMGNLSASTHREALSRGAFLRQRNLLRKQLLQEKLDTNFLWMSIALLKSAILRWFVTAYKGSNTFRVVKIKKKEFKIGWRPHFSKFLHETQRDRHKSDNGYLAFNTAGSAQLEFSSSRVPKYTLGPTSLVSLNWESSKLWLQGLPKQNNSLSGCQKPMHQLALQFRTSRKTITQARLFLSDCLYYRCNPGKSMLSHSTARSVKNMDSIRCFTSVCTVLASSIFFSPRVFL